MAYLRFTDHIDPGQGGSAMFIPEYPPWNLNIKPEKFPCKHCAEVFTSYDDWFNHRFHIHPIFRPLLIFGEIEIISPRFSVTEIIPIEKIRIVNTQTCMVNGRETSTEDLAKIISGSRNEFFIIDLLNDDKQVKSSYEILVEIPAESHILIVEEAFSILSVSGNLSVYSINTFIQSALKATTAKKYMDGLANYLFGILGKDQRGDTKLTQEQGRAKFNEALQTLQSINRTLARAVSAVIEFQTNVFNKSIDLKIVPSLKHAMDWFQSASYVNSLKIIEGSCNNDDAKVARIPLDAATDKLLYWVNLPSNQLNNQKMHIEKRAKDPNWFPEDRVKAYVLSAAISVAK